MNSPSVGKILTRLGRFGINPGLDRIRTVLELLGHPENVPVTIQIVGTNGKGSTAAAIDSILQAAGYRTGRYTSPHLSDVRERILLSGEKVPESSFAGHVRGLADLCTRHNIDLTFFEFLTATAFQIFAEASCQIVVLEAGMGGRWDATTAANPCLTVLTQVERDHEEILGVGIERIFEEKVAVGRPGRPFVATLTDPSLRARFIERSREMGFIPLLDHRDFEGEWASPDNQNGEPRPFRYRGRWGSRDLFSSLTPSYQLSNLSGALAAIEWSNLSVPLQAIRDGLLSLKMPGRLEQVMAHPPVILDGAHNPSAIRALCASLRDRFGSSCEIGFFVGIHAVKDWKDMLGHLALEGSAFFFPFPERRDPGLPVDGAWAPSSNLAAMVHEWAKRTGASPPVREGDCAALLQEGISWANDRPGRILVMTGSLYLVGAVRDRLIPLSDPPLFSLNERDLPGPDLS